MRQLSLTRRRPWAEGDHATFYFALGVISGIRVVLLGEIYIGELLALCMTAYGLSSFKVDRKLAPLFALTLMWCIAQSLSDIQNHTDLTTSLKGVLAPLVFFGTVYAIATHFNHGQERRIWYFLAGTTIFQMWETVMNPMEAALMNPWKWGFATPLLALLLAYLSARRAGKLSTVGCLLAFSATSIVFDFRSLAAMAVLGAIVFLARNSSFVRKLGYLVRKPGGVLLIFAVLATVIYILNVVFTLIFAHSAEFGFLSPESVHKYTVQATSEYGILFGGRSEIVISVKAFLDAPLLGHGSWALDRHGYVDEYNRLTHQMGMALTDRFDELESPMIPTHSYLMGAMVWCGIAGGIFWLSVVGGCLRMFLLQARYMPVYFCVALPQFIWDAFFSPFGAANRWQAAVFVGIIFAFSALQQHRVRFRAPAETGTRPSRLKFARSV